MLRARPLHAWSVTPEQALRIQRWLASRVRHESPARAVRVVCGVDVAYAGSTACAAAVLWDARLRETIDIRSAVSQVQFPYMPGLLAFRELPAVLAVLALAPWDPHVLLCNGHGLAHPRRFGMACHLGLLLERPTVGCAQRLLCGSYEEPAPSSGASSALMEGGEMIGRVVRTRAGARPLFVSPGHLMGHACAEEIVLACTMGHRMPEPLRLAHLAAREGLAAAGEGSPGARDR